MDGLTVGQRAMLRGCADHLVQAKVQAGTVLDTLDGGSLEAASLRVVQAETRLLLALVTAVQGDPPVRLLDKDAA